jgi:ATP-dependent DNA ligase
MKPLQPSRCTAGLPQSFDKEYLVGEPKLDGSRYLLYLGCDPYERQDGNTVLSRRISSIDSKHVDRTANVPHITDTVYDGLDGTVLDGEMFLKDFPTTSSIMGSGGKLAVQKQETGGWIGYYVWDVLFFKGRDIRGLSLEKRRKVLFEVVKRMGNAHVKIVPQFRDIDEKFAYITQHGGEGVIVKDVRLAYGQGWAKMKKSYDVSCVISGYKPGNGKYSGQVGALELAVYDGGKLIPIGYASGFNDQIRTEISADFSRFVGKVVDVFAHELSKPSADHYLGRLRHPTWHRFRDDVEAADCTVEKLKADFKTKIRSDRWKR